MYGKSLSIDNFAVNLKLLKKNHLSKKKTQYNSFEETDKLILKFICKFKGLITAKIILKKNKEDSHLLISKLTTKLQGKQDSVVLA